MRMIEISQIAEMLAARAYDLAAELLPNGRREGHEFRVGSLAGEPGRSMAVHLMGARAGVWSDFSSGESGDALDLVAAVLFGGNKRDAFKWALGWLGLDGTDPARLKQTRLATARRVAQAEADSDDEGLRKRETARRMWCACQPELKGTLAEVYLQSRAIDLGVLGRQPRALRFAPALWNVESGQHWPALVAAVTNGAGEMVAIHRTYLARDGRSKAALRDPKLTLGSTRGGSIKLWRGMSAKPIRQAPEGEAVVLCEGIEDGLSIAMACPDLRVLSAVSLANMRHVELPPQIGGVIIAADNDGDNVQAAQALRRAVDAHLEAGREVKIARSPVGKDFNDCLRAQKRGVA